MFCACVVPTSDALAQSVKKTHPVIIICPVRWPFLSFKPNADLQASWQMNGNLLGIWLCVWCPLEARTHLILASMYILMSDFVNGISIYTYTSAAGVQYQQRNYVIKGRTKKKKTWPLKKENVCDFFERKKTWLPKQVSLNLMHL